MQDRWGKDRAPPSARSFPHRSCMLKGPLRACRTGGGRIARRRPRDPSLPGPACSKGPDGRPGRPNACRANRGSPSIAPGSQQNDEKNDPTVLPHVECQKGVSLEGAPFGKVFSSAERDPQPTLACSNRLFVSQRLFNDAQTRSEEAAFERKYMSKSEVSEFPEAVGPPWFGADLTVLPVSRRFLTLLQSTSVIPPRNLDDAYVS